MPGCCSSKTGSFVDPALRPSFATGSLEAPSGAVWSVRPDWSLGDWLGALRVRLDIGRMDYAIAPGLYAVGSPGKGSPVLATGNYKLSFDHLRRALKGFDAWILAIDTKGINVWCAAGKGTFGTCELSQRVESCKLSELVSHRELIVPQLGAPGVAAHEVTKRTGFKVVYGPVRASELPEFLRNGMKATRAMRTVEFALPDRLAVIPVEVVHWSKWLIPLFALCAAASGLGAGGFHWASFAGALPDAFIKVAAAFLGGVLLGPALFPWLPGRAFAVKGVCSGLLASAMLWLAGLLPLDGLAAALQSLGWLALTLAISSFLMLAYTGSSPVTSMSGTRLETKIAFPLQAAAVAIGLALLVSPIFISRS